MSFLSPAQFGPLKICVPVYTSEKECHSPRNYLQAASHVHPEYSRQTRFIHISAIVFGFGLLVRCASLSAFFSVRF